VVGRSNSVHGLTSTGLVLPAVNNQDGRRFSSSSTSSGSAGPRMCRVYATIREITSKRSTTVCGGGGGTGARQKTVHVSVDHQVER